MTGAQPVLSNGVNCPVPGENQVFHLVIKSDYLPNKLLVQHANIMTYWGLQSNFLIFALNHRFWVFIMNHLNLRFRNIHYYKINSAYCMGIFAYVHGLTLIILCASKS